MYTIVCIAFILYRAVADLRGVGRVGGEQQPLLRQPVLVGQQRLVAAPHADGAARSGDGLADDVRAVHEALVTPLLARFRIKKGKVKSGLG